MGARIRIAAIAAMTVTIACSGHDRGVAPKEECPGAEAHAYQLKRIQGSWKVGYADYEKGQKPPGARRIGVLEFSGCRYSFTPRPSAELAEAGALEELALSRRELPFVDAPRGTIELAAPGPWRYRGQPQVLVTLVPEPIFDSPSWSIELTDRLQAEAEYLFFVPGEKTDFHRWEIERGEWQRQRGEYIPGSDPDNLPPDVAERFRELYERP